MTVTCHFQSQLKPLIVIMHCSTKAKRPIRSRPKKSRVGDGPSNASIGIVPVVLVSETEDSDFLPDEQPIGDEYIDVSDDYEASKTMKKPSRNTNSIDKSSKRRADKEKKKQLKEDDKIELNWEKWEKELDEWKPWGNDGEIDLDALVKKKGPVDVKEPPPELLMPLLPFQKEWLAWSLKQEESEFNGGFGELQLFEHQIAGPDGGSPPLQPWFLPSNSNSLQIATGKMLTFRLSSQGFNSWVSVHGIA